MARSLLPARVSLATTRTLTTRDRAREAHADGRLVLPEQLDPQSVVVDTTNLWVCADLGAGWEAWYRMVLQHGALVVGEIRVFPGTGRSAWEPAGTWPGVLRGLDGEVPAGGLTSTIVKRVRLGSVNAARRLVAFERKRRVVGPAPSHLPPTLAGLLRGAGAKTLGRPTPSTAASRRGRPSLALSSYAKVARAYVAAVEAGSAHPVQDAARTLKLTFNKTRDQVFRARRMGLITPTIRGRRGGRLTPDGDRAARQQQ